MSEIWKQTQQALERDPSYRMMFHLMERFPSDTAAEITRADGSLFTRSYGEYSELSFKACGGIQHYCAPKPGDIIGLNYDTCMDWPVLFWGILMAGGIPLLMNPASDADLSSRILSEAQAVCYLSPAEIAGCGKPRIDTRLILDWSEPGTENWADSVALYTSGTTGNSRIFLYDGATITAQLLSFDEAKQKNEDMPFVEDSSVKLLAFLPFHHVFGFSVIYILYSCTGKTIVYLRDKAVNTILEACRTHGVTHLYCVPMFFNALAGGIKKRLAEQASRAGLQPDPSRLASLPPEALAAIREGILGNRIRSMITGGGHIPAETLSIINLIGYPLYNGFGMTESGIISVEMSKNPLQRMKGSIGTPFSLTQVKIIPVGADPEGDNESDRGEMLIRGDALYTSSIIDGRIVPRDKRKWFSTGDLVSRREDGLYMEGRVKDVIIGASGENVYPDEIEDYFSALPGVSKLCIVGVLRGDYEEVTLLLEPGQSWNEETAVKEIDAVNRRLPAHQKAARILVSKEKLPQSGSLKIKRQLLKAMLSSGEWPCTEIGVSQASAPAAKTESPVAGDAALDDIKQQVRSIVAEALCLDESAVGDSDRFIEDLGGNSLGLVSAINAVENHFNIMITNAEFKSVTTVNEASRLVYEKMYHKSLSDKPAPKTDEASGEEKRITDFAQSPEYRALRRRMEETFAGGYNPYFVAHDSLIRDTSVIEGKSLINLGSYNYLGMSGHPETMQAAIDAVKTYGTSASGSRTLAGEKTLYRQLEKALADWKHTQDAIVCTGGWATNLTFISCFMGEGDFIVYDALSHNSITEGVALSKAQSKSFPHNDLDALEHILARLDGRFKKVLIVVEGVYSMDGDIAPIPRFVELKRKYNCFLMVDEAHSSGVIGDHAGGVDDYFHLAPHDVDIKYGTLSKALGTCGGYIAADAAIIEYLRYSMNGFVFTAGIAPPLAAACMKAIEIIRRDDSMARALHRNIAYFVRRAKEEGMNTCLAGESAIVPILIGSDAEAAKISKLLIDQGVFIPPAMYPAVPMGESRMRVTISATHSIEQLETAITALAGIMRSEGLLA